MFSLVIVPLLVINTGNILLLKHSSDKIQNSFLALMLLQHDAHEHIEVRRMTSHYWITPSYLLFISDQ